MPGQINGCYDSDKIHAVINEARIQSALRQSIHELNFRNDKRDTIILNPVIIQRSDGGDASASIDLLEQSIAAANQSFESSKIYFKYCGQPTIVYDDKYYNLSIEEGAQFNELMHVKNTINVYIASTISESFADGTVGLFCGIASFPKPETESRYILLDGSCLNDETLLAHELGHFYGLYHTHETSFGEELVSKVNCEVAGDFLCDTPADPRLNNTNVVNCRYFGQQVDAEGDAYRPDTKNIMSYAPQGCRSIFSWQQLFRMREIHKNENSYLLTSCDFPDFTVKIDTFFAAFRPGQEIKLPIVISNLGSKQFNGLSLDVYLSDDPEVKTLLLSSKTILFPENQSQIRLRQKVDLPVDLPETDQYLIVEVDGDLSLKELDENNNIATLAYRVDYGNLTDVSLYPNPSETYSRLFIRNESLKGEVIIKVFNTSGRLILKRRNIKQFETFQAEINTEYFIPGIYFIEVQVMDSDPYQLRMVKL